MSSSKKYDLCEALVQELMDSVKAEYDNPHVLVGYLGAMLRDAAMRSPKTVESIKYHIKGRKARKVA